MVVGEETPAEPAQPLPDTLTALAQYYRPIVDRRFERLAQLRQQSGTLIQTELTVLGLILIVLVGMPPGASRVAGITIGAVGAIAYAVSIASQLPIHAARVVEEMPSSDRVYGIQIGSDASDIRAAELQSSRIVLNRLRDTHEDLMRRYVLAFRLFLGGTVILGVGFFASMITEVML